MYFDSRVVLSIAPSSFPGLPIFLRRCIQCKLWCWALCLHRRGWVFDHSNPTIQSRATSTGFQTQELR